MDAESTEDYLYKNIPKTQIKPHPGFEIVRTKKGHLAKLAYESLYDVETQDLRIELDRIRYWENALDEVAKKELSEQVRKNNLSKCKKYLIFHYRAAISIISPEMSEGWNRWSEDILRLFISEKLHRVLWGSGNCGKSHVMALLLYIKWIVNPTGRMVIIASKVMTESKARVYGYIKEIHAKAPVLEDVEIKSIDSNRETALYTFITKEGTGEKIKNERGCIISLPVKVSGSKAEVDVQQYGGNLIGRHPKERMIIGFDECQEHPGSMLEMQVFHNWYTNENVEVHAWGNPGEVDFHAPQEWDLLFKLGAGWMSLEELRAKKSKAKKTGVWFSNDTEVLHISALDSPKDDADEQRCYRISESGRKQQRLWFLAGADTVKRSAEKLADDSPAWFSQVLGFPYIETSGKTTHQGVLTPFIIKQTKDYPLLWKDEEYKLQKFMGVDPSLTGHSDECVIAVGTFGMMVDGRYGLDLHNGKYFKIVKPVPGEEFADVTIDEMWQMSQKHNIPLRNIAIETHAIGDVYRYALNRHIAMGKWSVDTKVRKERAWIVDPTSGVSEGRLFRTFGNMRPAKEICYNGNTEHYLAFRNAVEFRQVFNIPEQGLKQFYNRMLIPDNSNRKVKVEDKKSMRTRGIKSPNWADAIVNLFDCVRHNGFVYAFKDSFGYEMKYGEAFDLAKQAEVVGRRLEIVNRILSVGINGGYVSSGRRGIRFNTDTV